MTSSAFLRNPSRSYIRSCHAHPSLHADSEMFDAHSLDNREMVTLQEIDSITTGNAKRMIPLHPTAIGQYNSHSISHPPCSAKARHVGFVSSSLAPVDDSTSSDVCSARNRPRPPWRRVTVAAPLLAKMACLFGFAPAVSAAPTIAKRSGGGSSDIKIIIPVVVVCVLLLIGVVVVVIRKRWYRRMQTWGESAAANFGPNPGVTELTAQQLAGPDAPIPRSRRTRRNRRTPSQISSRSLPVYMKEPGEHEVVIYRGPDDMEDATTTNIVMPMPSVTETAETPDLSVSIDASISVSRIYVPMPDSAHDMPLLTREDTRSTGEIDPPAGLSANVSIDDSQSALLQGRSPDPNATPDPRGEAPSYFEVVAMDRLNAPSTPDLEASPQLSLDESPTPDPSTDNNVPANLNQPEPTRRSRFLGLFHGRHGSTRAAGASAPADSSAPATPNSSSGHMHDDSLSSLSTGPAIYSNRNSRMRSGSQTHRPSFSGSGSLFSVMSRSRSHLLDSPTPGGPLTSPSMISLNSISAPIPHTLVRTEFTYPRAGPTPEQITLISSREGIVRFGVPYGDEAIAYRNAASSSRMDLPDVPPPDFEEVMGVSRTDSGVTDELEEPTPRRPSADLPATNDGVNDNVNPVDSASSGPPTENSFASASERVDAASESSASQTTPAVSISVSSPLPNFVSAPNQAVSSSPSGPRSAPDAEIDHPLANNAGSSASSDVPDTHQSYLYDRTPSPTKPKAPSPLFQSSVARAESRASSRSYTTFATAEESLPSGSDASAAASPTLSFTFVTTPLTEEPEVVAMGEQVASEEPTPRVVPRDISQEADRDDDVPVTPTSARPISSSTEVGRAL